jgi:hypothetical protein
VHGRGVACRARPGRGGVGGELDSKEFHGETDKLDDTLRRHGRFRGLELCHVTPGRYRANPDAFHRQLFEMVAERQAMGLGDPPGLELKPRGPLLQGTVRTASPYRLAA